MSHDFEDLIYLSSKCRAWLEEIQKSGDAVRKFISETFKEFQTNPNFEEAITYSLAYGETDRLGLIQQKILKIISLGELSGEIL